MPLPKLSPLQSRLAASLLASILLLMLYLMLSSSHLAYAADVDSIQSEDHNRKQLPIPYILETELDYIEPQNAGYEAEFLGADRSIIGRVPQGQLDMENNNFQNLNIQIGGYKSFLFPSSALWGPRTGQPTSVPSFLASRGRGGDGFQNTVGDYAADVIYPVSQNIMAETTEAKLTSRQTSSRTLYVTLNTCLQPDDPNDTTGSIGPPPQLELYVSTTDQNQSPGPNQSNDLQKKAVAIGGYAGITVEASGNVYIGVSAPNSTNYIHEYNFDVGTSIDAPFHSFHASRPDLYLIDSDSSSALLVTNNFTALFDHSTADAMSLSPPFVIFAANQNISAFTGVQNSYCGLEKYAQIAGTTNGIRTEQVQTGMNNVILGPQPKQQFYFQGLNRSSLYYATLAMTGNSTAAGKGVVGGGGQVWHNVAFRTQSDGNCVVIKNLSFCDSVAYAVPGNPQIYPNATVLAAFYDNAAKDQYANFEYAIQQIPCEIDSSSQYSLARNCTDCRNAYKKWLCSVMIPRCMDYSARATWLQERNIVQPFPNGTNLSADVVSQASKILYLNSSRNPNIDLYVQPGPYKEILPCDDLCYNIVQSCPASMGFNCLRPGMLGFNHSYGLRPNGSLDQAGQVTCNYPGAAYNLNAATGSTVPFVWVFGAAFVLGLLLS